MLDSKYLLTDEQMLQFIAKGYLVLRNDLPLQLHQSVMNEIYHVFHEEGNPGNNILPRVPDIQQFFDTPVVKGALTSVLGPDYYMHPHRHCHYNQPKNQTPGGGQWHKDGFWSSMRSHRPWWAMIFYYTHDITEELGPTAIMPGTQYYEKFIGDRGETLLPTGKAGTMVLVHFDLWHKATLNVTDLDRYMLKFQFVRLRAPEYPSWNHQSKEMIVPEGTPAVHLNLWQDVWDWLRGERTARHGGTPSDAARLSQARQDLTTEDADARGRAADELGLLGEVAAASASALGLLLNDSVETTALNAAYALGHVGPKGVEQLIGHIASGTTLVAERAAYGLQGAGAEAVPGLLKVLEHKDEKRRALAAFVLGMIGPSAGEAVPSLIASLQDESEWVRRNAIEALGMIGNASGQVVPSLTKILEQSLLGETETQKSNDTYASNQSYIINKIGYTAALSLLRTGKEGDAKQVVRSLAQALHSKDRYVRAYAAEALTYLRTEEAVDVLIRYYRTSRWCPDTNKASTF
ncbi:HEAT repeat domain-containing protein [Cohnella nanjingensis]|uniref:HEAT repeat domain-containing protein n=1 Tax=Cohnella nanjingensis TaxID=1387779 RepID=A0A7X0RV35_9BACL|nr:HEAT repeat domain-containing protein [Cohnella nanjingensis]MBB6673051.1 HEAT repeat domain-containing protein [Cohnella nanjingensis]